MHRSTSRLQILLATTSVAALMVGGSGPAQADDCGGSGQIITGTSSGFTNPAGGPPLACIFADNATVTGNIVNAGTVSPGTAFGIEVQGGTFTGSVINTGTISSGGTGIVVNTPTFTGSISNSGTIEAPSASGISVFVVSLFTGSISNNNGGSITAGNTGIAVSGIGPGQFAGGITNSGTITAFQGGIRVSSIAMFGSRTSFSGGIRNAGTIVAGAIGIAVANVQTFLGGITNSGTISAGIGILVFGGGTFSGAIVNSGVITDFPAGAAIDVSAAPNAMTIDQTAGTISGDIKLSAFADKLNVTGGTINGNIVGTSLGQAAGNAINFRLGTGTFTYGSGYSISLVNQLNVYSGLVILDGGSNSVTNVTVAGGTLEIGDASNPGAVLTATNGLTVEPGGTLAGHGTVAGSITIPAGATLAPGGSIGTLNVTGNLSLAAGSFYAVEVNAAGAGSTTNISGTATLGGGTVQVIEDRGNYALGTRYTILTADGGVDGTFGGATSSFAFLTPVLGYGADDVFVTLDRNATYFQSLAQTANQHAVGAALDASPFGSAIVQALLFESPSDTRQAFDALSGEVHAGVQSVLIDDSHYLRQAVLGRLRQAAYAGSPGTMGALSFAGPDTVAAPGGSPAPALGYDASKAFPAKAPPAAAQSFWSDLTFWTQGVGAWGQFQGDGNAAGVRRDLGGFFSGVDARFGDLVRLGFAGGYTHSSVSDDARASSAGIDTAHLGVYAGANVGGLDLRGGGAYAFHTIDTSRAIIFPGFFDSASARYDGGTGQIFGEVGWGVALREVAAEPFAGLAWVHLHTDSFAETGGVSALDGSGSHDDVGYATLGARAATSYLLANGWALIPRASAAWQHAFGDTTPTAALTFQATGAGFAVAGVPLARDAALVETGLDLRISPQAKLCLSYSGELASRLQDHAVKGSLTWNF